MKRIIAVALLATTIAFGQNQKKNAWERAGLKGKIKTYVQSGYEIADDGQEIPMNSEMFTEFDKKGKPVKMTAKQRGMTIKYVDKYDDKGNRIESASVDDSNTLLSKNVYEYDERGNITKHDVEMPDGSIFMTRLSVYDSNDRLIERTECIAGMCNDRTTYVYDNNDKISEETKYNKDAITNKTIYSYDAKGNAVEKKMLDADNNLKQRVTSTFDDNNNEVEVKYFDKEGNLTKTETYKFEYDKKKNWLKKTMSVDGKPKMMLTQKLKYF